MTEFSETLKAEFELRRARNPRATLRAFAQSIGLSPSGMTRLFRGGLKLSSERAAQVLQTLQLDAVEKNRLLLLMGRTIQKLGRTKIGAPDDAILTDWVYLAVLLSFECDIDRTPEALARRFRRSPAKIQRVIADLCARGLLEHCDGELQLKHKHWMSGDSGIAEKSVRRHHEDALDIASEALALPVATRDFSSMTFSGDASQLKAVQEETRLFYDRVLAIMGAPGQTRREVFKISVQLFPLNFSGSKHAK